MSIPARFPHYDSRITDLGDYLTELLHCDLKDLQFHLEDTGYSYDRSTELKTTIYWVKNHNSVKVWESNSTDVLGITRNYLPGEFTYKSDGEDFVRKYGQLHIQAHTTTLNITPVLNRIATLPPIPAAVAETIIQVVSILNNDKYEQPTRTQTETLITLTNETHQLYETLGEEKFLGYGTEKLTYLMRHKDKNDQTFLELLWNIPEAWLPDALLGICGWVDGLQAISVPAPKDVNDKNKPTITQRTLISV